LEYFSLFQLLPDGKDRVVMTAWYNKSDSLPSSPASTAAGLADISPTDSDIDIERYENVIFTADHAASCFPHKVLVPCVKPRCHLSTLRSLTILPISSLSVSESVHSTEPFFFELDFIHLLSLLTQFLT
jgi:hypothetical protein